MQIDALEYEINQIEQLLESKLINRRVLTSNVFFACQNCDGPLIPSSLCVVCHKSSMRLCQKCGLQKKFGFHLLCSYLVLLNENKKNKPCKVEKLHD
jgi:hypothetical protein